MKTEGWRSIQKRRASWLARLSLAVWGSANVRNTSGLLLHRTHGSGASVPPSTAGDAVLLSRDAQPKKIKC